MSEPLNETSQYTLLPEWAEQEAIILAWPHETTDWALNLAATKQCYLDLIANINACDVPVLLLCDKASKDEVKTLLPADARLAIIEAEYNDTWVRDYAFITVASGSEHVPLNFLFNGWGQKFKADKDNAVNAMLSIYCRNEMRSIPVVLEGGAIEIDENQHLLSTQSCLLNPKRNGDMSIEEYRTVFKRFLGATEVTVFENGHLEGDDTDGHIDTLVRYTPLMGIVLQSCNNRPSDSHFEGLFKLKKEIQTCFPNYKIYELPLPNIQNEVGERLPASYANYLILNKHIIMPVYQEKEDQEAVDVLQNAYPNYTIRCVNCAPLIAQFGSLHCISMQVPTNTLKSEFIDQLQFGVVEI